MALVATPGDVLASALEGDDVWCRARFFHARSFSCSSCSFWKVLTAAERVCFPVTTASGDLAISLSSALSEITSFFKLSLSATGLFLPVFDPSSSLSSM